MNRKQFIQSIGATCLNWTWSWSFVNHNARFVIFGLWQNEGITKLGLILHADWEYLGTRKQNGYSQAVEHIRLVEEEGYALRTFPMIGTPRDPDKGDLSPAKISKFVPELTERRLVALPGSWHVASLNDDYETIAEVIEPSDASSTFMEGSALSVLVNVYERNHEARKACIMHYGTSCRVCEADFGEVYGSLGEGYIHVHHVKPIHLCGGEYKVDPIKDLIPVCANCHTMIHRGREPLTVEELREVLETQRQRKTDRSFLTIL